MNSKDQLMINENIIIKIIKQIYVEQKHLFTKKNYLKAKNEDEIYLSFNDKEVEIVLAFNTEYIKEQDKFSNVIIFEIKSMIEGSTTYLVNNIDIKFEQINK